MPPSVRLTPPHEREEIEYSDELAREWIEEASRVQDRQTVATAERALAGDPDAQREVVRWEREARKN